MSLDRYRPHLALLALLALASLALTCFVNVRIVDQVGVRLELPAQVGDWNGEDLFFCHNEKCLRSFTVSQLAGNSVCPVCGGEIRQTWSWAESQLLPGDTVLLRKLYARPSGRQMMVSIVVSGKEQASIHRPEICLVSQGHEVGGRSTFAVPLPGRGPLKVAGLDIFQRFRAGDGTMAEQRGYFAYWFVAPGRETPYHLDRMTRAAIDRVLFSRAYRWAYVSISGTRSDSADYRDEVREFVPLFYPLIKGLP